MQFGVKIDIKTQTVSDLITNSSSEVFCRIQSDRLKEIIEILRPLFPNTDSEMGPTLCYWEEDQWDDNSPSLITIEFPYGMEGYEEFYKQGLKAVLDQYFGSENYSITYEN